MSIEYHGWIVLATSREDWDDGDFADAFDRVRRLLAAMSEESGQCGNMTEQTLPMTVYLSGYGIESSDDAVRLLKSVSQIFDRSCGELAVYDLASGSWCPSRATRIVLSDGQVRE
jgi:hypothetical protein